MESILFTILKSAISAKTLDSAELSSLTETEWKKLFNLSVQQGVRAVALEAISQSPLSTVMPKPIKMKWLASVMGVEDAYHSRLQKAAEFAKLMASKGLHTLTLKGAAVSTYYPESSHREFGDLDAYLFYGTPQQVKWGSGYEQGNVWAEEFGAKVSRGHYKHSHVTFKGLMIENHQYFLPIRGNKSIKELEKYLRTIAFNTTDIKYVGNTKLLIPSSDFNALFLTAHAMNHFLYETVRLRHVCDWALFLKAEQDNVDWKKFYQWCDKMHYTHFVNCLNYICHHYLGIELCTGLSEDGQYVDRVLDDIWAGDNVYNKGYSNLRIRLEVVRNFFQSSWKYSKICKKNAFVSLLSHGIGVLFDRNPVV